MALMILAFYTLIQAFSRINVTFQGELLPSSKELSSVKYFLLSNLQVQDFEIKDLPIFPYTPISAVILDTTPLRKIFPELLGVKQILEDDITRRDRNNPFLKDEKRIKTLELPEEIKIATLFTSEVPFKENSEWPRFIRSYDGSSNSINTLKDHLELAIPKKTLQKHEIKTKNFKYGVWLNCWNETKPTDTDNYSLFKGTVELRLYLPFNDVIRERFNKDFEKALETLRNRLSSKEFANLEERIKCMKEYERPPGFGFSIRRSIQLEQKAGNNHDRQYKLTFIEEDFSERKDSQLYNLSISFSSFINISKTPDYNRGTYSIGRENIPFYRNDGYFINASTSNYKHIKLLSSLFEKHFGIVSTEKNDTDGNSNEENNTNENRSALKTCGIYVFWFSLVCLVMLVLFLAYYYRKKKANYFNYSKRKQGKEKKNIK